jgi:hypothetical protein
MVCLFHDDYGPADPAFSANALSQLGARHWSVDASLLKDARNIGEAEAIERHLIRGETVAWCDQGYAWVEQSALDWFYLAVFLLVILPYMVMKLRAWRKGVGLRHIGGRGRLERRIQQPNLTSR